MALHLEDGGEAGEDNLAAVRIQPGFQGGMDLPNIVSHTLDSHVCHLQ